MASVTARDMVERALADESAAALVEYALVATLIALVCVGVLTLMYAKVASFFTTVANAM